MLLLYFLTLVLGLQVFSISACVRKAPLMSMGSDAYSPVELMYLANFESKLFTALSEASERVYDEVGLIKGYLEDYKKTTLEGTSHLPENTDEWVWAGIVSSHPFMAYKMIRRFIVTLPPILSLLEQHQEIDLLNHIHSARGNLKWPTIEDKEDVMLRILRIQTTYDLEISEFVEGELDIEGVQLSASDCVEIGRHAMTIGKYASAVEWTNIAFRKFLLKNDASITEIDSIVELTHAVNEHDKIFEHYNLRYSGNLENLWHYDLYQTPVGQLNTFEQVRLRHLPQKQDDNMFRALQLCKGENYQSEKVKANLRCWYETKKHPYTQISPLKVELLSVDPYLVLVYDFLSTQGVFNVLDETIITLNQMNPAHFNAISPVVHGTRKRRETPFTLMDDSGADGKLRYLSSKLECFAGHKADQCGLEHLHVLGHTFGNSDIHLEAPDTGMESADPNDNVTTVMVFLNQVDIGGYTVFPKIGIHVKPVKGSALLWWNIVQADERDTRLMYAECPVILGKKWIAKKKFHSSDEF